jgi:hypothetical protein
MVRTTTRKSLSDSKRTFYLKLEFNQTDTIGSATNSMKTFEQIKDEITQLDLEESRVDIVSILAKQTSYPPNIIKKGIQDGQLTINGTPTKKTIIEIIPGKKIKFQNKEIGIVTPKEKTRFDKFINILLREFSTEEIASLYQEQKVLLFAFVVEYFYRFKYDVQELGSSKFNEVIVTGLEEYCKAALTSLPETRSLRKKELVDQLISYRERSYQSFEKIVRSTTSNLYDRPEKLLNDYRHLFKEQGFRLLIQPLIGTDIDLTRIIEKIVKNLSTIREAENKNEQIELRSSTLAIYNQIEVDYFQGKLDRISRGLISVLTFFKDQVELAIGFKDTGRAFISIRPEERTYNFKQSSISISAIIENKGTGIAKKIRIVPNDGSPKFVEQNLTDILSLGEIRKVKFKIESLDGLTDSGFSFGIKWENEFKQEKIATIKGFVLKKQDDNLPWEDLRRSNPYNSSQIVDDPEKLYGREKLIEDFRWNIERNRFTNSYVLYGQKRVGKSSIVRTLETVYRDNPNVIFVYKTMFDLKDLDATRTFQKIGEVFSSKILSEYNRKVKKKESDEIIISKYSFAGSLSPLNDLVDQIHDRNPIVKFIIVIDEFDELNKEFFEDGELGKTFALSLGKGLNEKSYVGIILVGSENMVSKTSQGMRLNTFEVKKVDTFDKETEFDQYCKIIEAPGSPCLRFAAETLNFLYEVTNGNPYFTNFLANKIFLDAYERRISFVDYDHAALVVTQQISLMTSKDFEHFWADAVSDNNVLVLDRRKRLLTAYAETKNEGRITTWGEVKKKIKYSTKIDITEAQMDETLSEFKDRGIIRELPDKSLNILPKLFEGWLLEVGIYQVIAQLDDKDDVLEKVRQEQKLHLTDDELKQLATILDEQPGKMAPLLRNYLDQFDNNFTRRLIAELLTKSIVIPTDQLIDHIKRARKKIWGLIELGVNERDVRTDSEIVCLDSSINQNEPHTSLMKEVFKFVHNKNVKTPKDLASLSSETKNIILYEPLIDCPFYYRNELSALLKQINPVHVEDVTVHILCFIITDEAKLALEELLDNHFIFRYELHFLRVTQRSDISPFINVEDSINDNTWKALMQLDSLIDETSCLVKVGKVIPYQNIPILWDSENSKIKPLFQTASKRKVYEDRNRLSRALKDLKFKSESNKLEFKASMSEPAYNWKKIKELAAGLLKAQPEEALNAKKTEIAKLWSLKFNNAEKETLRKTIKHSLVKNLAAFANTSGGEIFVGIEDDFTVPGLVYDLNEYKSEEGVRKIFDSLVNEYLGKEFSNMFDLEFIELSTGTSALKITVQRTQKGPGVWVKIDKGGNKLKSNAEEFYIRGQQETNLLTAKEYANWVTQFAV